MTNALTMPQTPATTNCIEPVCQMRHAGRPNHRIASEPFHEVTPIQNRRVADAGALVGCQDMTLPRKKSQSAIACAHPTAMDSGQTRGEYGDVFGH